MSARQKPSIDNTLAGLSGVVANLLLGASSLYWKLFAGVSPATLLGYRILLSLVTLAGVMLLLGKFEGLVQRLTWRNVAIHVSAAILVALNWATFIWASIHGHVVESGLGYLIAPFVAIGFGAFALGDPMTLVRRCALSLIVLAVLILIARSGELSHWVYLVIGVTWGFYACLKKLTTLDAFSGLLCETLVLSGVLGVALAFSSVDLRVPDNLSNGRMVALLLCGFVSVLPLWLFSLGASRLPLSVMGFFQFVLPTTQLFVALAMYHQPVSVNTLACFATIWGALALIIGHPLISSRLQSPRKGST
jgi:chloramphenicol-sensitive protein RarD